MSDKKCLLCHHDDFQYLTQVRDSGKHSIYRCLSCGHIQLSPIPSDEEYEAFYQTNEMGRITVPQNVLDDEKLRLKNKVWIDKQVSLVKKIIPREKSIFEIGSGYGWFLKGIRDAGYTADGLELSREKCESAKANLGIEIYNISYPPPPITSLTSPVACMEKLLHTYDVVCIFHVLEHVPDPVSFLEQTKQFLRDDGQVLVEVPNFDDYMKTICLPYNNFQYLKAHLSYFTPDSLKSVFQKAGFKDITIGGEQKYGVLNAMRWLNEGKPNLVKYEFDTPQGLEWIDDYYKSELERTLKSYAIFALGRI